MQILIKQLSWFMSPLFESGKCVRNMTVNDDNWITLFCLSMNTSPALCQIQNAETGLTCTGVTWPCLHLYLAGAIINWKVRNFLQDCSFKTGSRSNVVRVQQFRDLICDCSVLFFSRPRSEGWPLGSTNPGFFKPRVCRFDGLQNPGSRV